MSIDGERGGRGINKEKMMKTPETEEKQKKTNKMQEKEVETKEV